MKLWMNGKIVAAEQAVVPVADRGFSLGDGLFETMRVRGGSPLHFHRHMARLAEGGAVIGLDLPAAETIATAIGDLLAELGQTDGIIRVTISRGLGPRGILPPKQPKPTLVVAFAPAPGPLGEMRLVTARVTRRNQFSPLARIKSLNYLDNILARMEAEQQGADDAVLLNTLGQVAETTACNLIARLGDKLVTPPVADGALPGIGRTLLVENGAVMEYSLLPEELFGAEAVVTINSLALRPVVQVDGKGFDAQSAHDLADRLQSLLI